MSWDPYLDRENGILRNRLGITTAAELAQAEAELMSFRLIELQGTDLPGGYDLPHLPEPQRRSCRGSTPT